MAFNVLESRMISRSASPELEMCTLRTKLFNTRSLSQRDSHTNHLPRKGKHKHTIHQRAYVNESRDRQTATATSMTHTGNTVPCGPSLPPSPRFTHDFTCARRSLARLHAVGSFARSFTLQYTMDTNTHTHALIYADTQEVDESNKQSQDSRRKTHSETSKSSEAGSSCCRIE